MSLREKQHLSRLHEHGLPRWVNWTQLSHAVVCAIQEVEALYPPERLWVFGPEGELRGTYVGDEGSVTVPLREMSKLYQAVMVHTHPPGVAPTVSDAWHATVAASPLLVVLEGKRAQHGFGSAEPVAQHGFSRAETVAHLISVWHFGAPGIVGHRLEQWTSSGLKEALKRVKGRWQTVPLKQLEAAIAGLEHDWKQFLEVAKGEG